MSFTEWFKRRIKENYGGSANDPSNVEDEGDGGDGVEKRREKPAGNPSQGYPSYSLNNSDLPITRKNKINYTKKKCNCK